MPRYDDDEARYDDDDDIDISRLKRPDREPNWLDQQFRNTSIVILVLFALCCGEISLIFGILGVCLCTDRTARTNATIVLVISAVRFGVAIIALVGRMAAGH
jgi:hypothetical protein